MLSHAPASAGSSRRTRTCARARDIMRFPCPRTTRLRSPSPTIVPSSVSGRTSICPSSRRKRSWRGSIPSWPRPLFGRPPLPFSVSIEFPAFDGPIPERALELARASAEYLEVRDRTLVRHRARFYPQDARQAARSVRDRRALRQHRRARRRSPGSLRARAVAAAALVPDPVTSPTRHGRTDRAPEGPADAGRGPQAARGGIQHVLRRTAAASALGDARPGRGDDQAARPRPHHRHRRSVPLRDAAVAASRR